MQFGLHAGTRGAAMDPDGLLTIARRAEALGFTHLGLSDHVVIAREVNSPYPYTKTGKWFAQDSGECLDQLTALAFVAAGTTTLRLLTSVMVLPHRPVVLTAKMLTTIDHLSRGRLTVGVGVGWMEEEIIALGAPTFKGRGKLADEYIEGFRELWTQDDPEYAGEYVNFNGILFEPKPTQKPYPPIWIGGETKPARRRAGKMGDGWYPVNNNPAAPYDTLDRYAAGLADMRAQADVAGRDPSAIETGLITVGYRMGEADQLDDGSRKPFTGSADDILNDVGTFRDGGLNHMIVGFESDDLQRSLDTIEEFAEAVMGKIG